jgi:hypothetical protein
MLICNKAFTDEMDNSLNFLNRHIENFGDFTYGHTGFEIVEYGLNGHPRSSENPCAPQLAGDAFHGAAL